MDTSSSVVSTFKFISYKIDKFNFEMKKQISILASKQNVFDVADITLGIKQPIFYTKNKYYVCGVECKIDLISNEKSIGNIESSISGIFTLDEPVGQELLEKIVKVQFPVILFPYLRSAITSFLANAGFGTFVLPLINVSELAKENLSGVPIQIVE